MFHKSMFWIWKNVGCILFIFALLSVQISSIVWAEVGGGEEEED